MSKIKEVYLPFGGGLGDVFYEYFRGKYGWEHLASLKELYPHIKVKVMSSTHNKQSLEFIRYHPHVDSMREFGWITDARPLWEQHRGEAIRLEDAVKEGIITGLLEKKQVLHTGPEDDRVIRKITEEGKFVLIHPFAGGRDRQPMIAAEYIPLINRIIDDLGYNVVVIGASHTRNNIRKPAEKAETFNYKREGLFNLVNNMNARVGIALAQQQSYFVGCWSSWACATWLHEKPNSILVPKEFAEGLRKRHRKGNRWQNVPYVSIHPIRRGKEKVDDRDKAIEAVLRKIKRID